MIKIAMVDDEIGSMQDVTHMLSDYFEKRDEEVQISTYSNSLEFLSKYKAQFDVIIIDIAMPGINGLEMSKKIREVDNTVIMVFLTSMKQFAINGYEVNAVGFIVKPVTEYSLALTMNRVLTKLQNKASRRLVINLRQGVSVVSTDELRYIDVCFHHVVYHTADKEIEAYGTLSEVEEKLKGLPFARCNNSTIVNLNYVTKTTNNSVFLGNTELIISRGKKKEFVNAVLAFNELKG